MTTDHHAPPDSPKTDLECAKFALDRLLEAIDNWPDDGQLNRAFNQASIAHGALSRWIKQREPDHHD